MKVQIRRLHPDAEIPTYATEGAAALDLRAIAPSPIYLHPGQSHMVHTGIAIHLDDTRYAAKILPRSGLGSKGIVLGNTIGLIDSDYTGELLINLWNRRTDGPAYIIAPRERIAQLVIMPIVRAQFVEVEEFRQTARADGGFGHSGRL